VLLYSTLIADNPYYKGSYSNLKNKVIYNYFYIFLQKILLLKYIAIFSSRLAINIQNWSRYIINLTS
jgi:hypothetical protein